MTQAANIQQFAAWTQQWIARLNQNVTRLAQNVAAVEARTLLNEHGRKPRMPMHFRSQYGEDMLLWALFEGQLDGFYIEVGAFDGVTLSVSYAFDAIGWDGLLIEALPEVASACKHNRPHARVENFALARAGATGTTTFNLAGDGPGSVFSYREPTASHTQLLQQQGVKSREITVPVTSLDALLESQAPTRPIDFAVIDVEGGEVELLAGFDIERWKPRALLIEDNTRGQDPALNSVFASLPYELVGWVEVNRLYIRNDEPELKNKFKQHAGL
ncbi:MAG: FkbM family methyltransferase [Phycisphaerales bacterium]|nr:FkbM family methyltransferase [Phycisphaerales bacterium]